MNISLILKKKTVWALIVIVLVIGGYFLWKHNQPKEQTMVVQPGEFIQQVSVSGKVIPIQDLDLSFEQSGRVTSVPVQVGDRVAAGQMLASQDTPQLDAQLSEVQANIDLQQARLTQFLAGASAEELQVLQTAVSNAQTSVDNANTSLQNAKQALLDSIKNAYDKGDDAISNKADQMFANAQTVSPKLRMSSVDSSLKSSVESQRFGFTVLLPKWRQSVQSLRADQDLSSAVSEAKMNLESLRSFFESLSTLVNNPSACFDDYTSSCGTIPSTWKTDVSTARSSLLTASSGLTTAEGSYKTAVSSLQSAQGALKTAEDQFANKKAPARSSDVSVYQAQIRQAESSKQNILAQMAKRQVRAPVAGIVTKMEGKVGKIISAGELAISMMSAGAMQIESFVPEKNLPFLKVGDRAKITLDAYGSSVPFSTTITSIDPAETIKDGVTTYRILLQFDGQDDRVKSGMTANVLIETEKKQNVIAVPQGIVEEKDGKKWVSVRSGDTVSERMVETGNTSSFGTIEIVSGLNPGDVVILKQTGK